MTKFPDYYAKHVAQFTRAAAISVLFLGGTAEAATTKFTDLKPIVQDQHGVTYYVVPDSRTVKDDTTGVVVVATRRDDHTQGYAMFTLFKCKEHTFSIPVVFKVTFEDGVLTPGEAVAVGPATTEFTSTHDGPWGETAEQFACTGNVPVLKSGDQT